MNTEAIKNLEVVFNQIVNQREEINKTAKLKGFWEEKDYTEKLMLMISELGEALEADRHKKWDPLKEFYQVESITDKEFQLNFIEFIKDSFEDEITDVVIRALDIIWQQDIKLEFSLAFKYLKEGKTSHLLFHLTRTIIVFPMDYGLNYFLNQIIYYAYVIWEIDLLEHIRLKMKFNTLRKYKHGKEY